MNHLRNSRETEIGVVLPIQHPFGAVANDQNGTQERIILTHTKRKRLSLQIVPSMSADTPLPSESHPLHNHYRFWRTVSIESNVFFVCRFNDQTENYESQLDDLGSCETVEQFWDIYCSLPTIGSADADNYYFFKVCSMFFLYRRMELCHCGKTPRISKAEG